MNLKKIPFDASKETLSAVNAAVKAGKSILKVYNRAFSSTLKEDKEPVTEADLKSQDIILKELSKTGYPIISEESKDREGLKHSETWIIDPLDGTSDFIDKTGEFSVMIGFVKNHIPALGVIYQPTEDILYVSQTGYGAYQFVNGVWSKLSVNNNSKIDRCKAIVSRHHLAENEKAFLDELKISRFTQKGSCGLKVAEICKGNAELYFTMTDKIKQWDTCAAYCLLKESGGKMTDMLGNDLRYNTEIMNHKNGILATNSALHPYIIGKYRERQV